MTLFELFGKIVIENSEANSKMDETADKAKNLGEKMTGAGNDADGLSEKLGESSGLGAASVWLGNTLSILTTKAANLGKELVKSGINYNAEMESLLVSFEAFMHGDTEKAAALLEDIRQLASVTPMDTMGLAKNAQTLMGYGIAAENVIDTLKMLGDAALGNQTVLDRLVLAYAQVQAAGKLNAQDANQFVNAGVPIWKFIAEMIDEDISTVRELAKGGNIGADMVTEALKIQTSENGQYYKQMEKQAESYSGQMATFADNSAMTIGQLFSSVFDVLKSDVLPRMNESLELFGQWVEKNQDSLKKFSESIGSLVTNGFDKLLNCFQWITENGETLQQILPALGTAFLLLGLKVAPLATGIGLVVAGLTWLASGDAGKGVENLAHKVTEATDGVVNADSLIKNSEKEKAETTAYMEKEEKRQYAIKPPDADASAEDIQEWFDTVDPELLKEFDIKKPDPSMTKEDIEAWWKGARPNLTIPVSLLFPIMPTDVLNNMNRYSNLKTLEDAKNNGIVYNGPTSHKTGLDFVPRDNYLARLHQGEAVLTADEARDWRNRQREQQEIYKDEIIITGNNFYIQQEQDIYDLAVELSGLRRESRRGRGGK